MNEQQKVAGAVALLRGELGSEIKDMIRKKSAELPLTWWAETAFGFTSFHFGLGMAIRNTLRHYGFDEAYFGVQTLDGIYIKLVELACQEQAPEPPPPSTWQEALLPEWHLKPRPLHAAKILTVQRSTASQSVMKLDALDDNGGPLYAVGTPGWADVNNPQPGDYYVSGCHGSAVVGPEAFESIYERAA